MKKDDTYFMKLALTEARKGVGRTSPNPAVGAVVVKNGKIIGKGYHRRVGTPHAEPNALNDAGRKTCGATLYVTLEPCNHQERTPPCTHAILESGIARVVVGVADLNPQVAGGGNTFLRDNGVDVHCGVLEEKCRELNLPFNKHIVTGLPWVTLKAGMSLDGRIAAGKGKQTRITSDDSRRHVHRLRDTVDAILVGIETVLIDNPSLTTRFSSDTGSDPVRGILDSRLRISIQSKCIQQRSEAGVLVFCNKRADFCKAAELNAAGVEIVRVSMKDNGLNLREVLAELGKRNVLSVLVEGGAKVYGSFLHSGLADQLLLYIAPTLLGNEGVPLVDFADKKTEQGKSLRFVSSRRLGVDQLLEGRFSERL